MEKAEIETCRHIFGFLTKNIYFYRHFLQEIYLNVLYSTSFLYI